MSKFSDAVEAGLEGLDFVSPGIIEDCKECPDIDESHFSWSPCDCCGSSLGGDRHAAHGRDKNGELVHLDICVDCLMFIANGDEPEQWTDGEEEEEN